MPRLSGASLTTFQEVMATQERANLRVCWRFGGGDLTAPLFFFLGGGSMGVYILGYIFFLGGGFKGGLYTDVFWVIFFFFWGGVQRVYICR